MTESSGLTGATQQKANDLTDAAQSLANDVIDIGEEAVGTVLAAVIAANKTIGEILESLSAKLVG